jgi:hypothetical protein
LRCKRRRDVFSSDAGGQRLLKAVKAQIACNTLLLAYTNVVAFEERSGRRSLALICLRFFGNLFRPGPSDLNVLHSIVDN